MTMTAPDNQRLLLDAEALAQSVGVRSRDDLCVVRVRGEDRVTWLNGQVTADVRHIGPGHGVHALAVNVRGKIMGDIWVLPGVDELVLLLPRRSRDTLLQSLERYIIMEDVTLTPDDASAVLSLQGPEAALTAAQLAEPAEAYACDELGAGGMFIVTTAHRISMLLQQLDARVPRVSDAAFELARLRARVSRYERDYDEHHYPQEAGLKALLSFNKGCYLGQEVVCTLENRGRMHRQLCALRATGNVVPVSPTLTPPDATDAVGHITSHAYDPARDATLALGYVKAVHAQAGRELRTAEAAWTIDGVVGESA
jgi:tRNA-modifying protein YgfZ